LIGALLGSALRQRGNVSDERVPRAIGSVA
jgi:hypothetical protein